MENHVADVTCQALPLKLTQETRVYNVEDDVAGVIGQALGTGVPLVGPDRSCSPCHVIPSTSIAQETRV